MAEKCSKLSTDGTAAVVRLVRQLPPVHCALKIESFSLLRETLGRNKHDKLESTEFSVGGYTWVLSLYPKGNNKEHGEGHISLYVRIVDKLNAGNFVNAIVRFFIYDQIQDNYLIIQDIKERRFHPLKMEWGISRVISISDFEDTSNGFLLNDCCILGAEVFVLKGDNKLASFTMLKPQSIRTYTWRVTELKEWISSPTFIVEGRQWQLSLWHRGCGREKGKNVSLFLWLNDVSELTGGRKLYAEYELCIKNQLKGDDHKETSDGWFSTAQKGWGSADLLPLSDLDNPSKGFKVKDVIVVEVNFNVIYILKDV